MRQLGRGNRPDRNGEIPARNEIPGRYRTARAVLPAVVSFLPDLRLKSRERGNGT